MKKIIALILTLTLALSLLAGCDYQKVLENYFGEPTTTDSQTVDADPTTTAPDETDVPEVSEDGSKTEPVNPALVYTLDQAMIDDFYAKLELAEEASINGESWEIADEATNVVDDAYMALVDQNQIAYVLYCLDQTDETLSKQYLDTTDLITQAELDYNAMIRRVYQSDTPYKEQLFEGWTQAEIDRMLKHNEEIAAIEARNAEITLEYRELDPTIQEEEVVTLYNELVSNNNRMAQIYGYENYYVFATEVVYERDYDNAELKKMRNYVAQYLPDAYLSAIEGFYALLGQITEEDYELLNGFLGFDYDKLEDNYVELYLADLPESVRNGMQNMFDNDRVVFTDSENAYEGAFTTSIGEKPFCYYGPYYQNSETIVHELGHYYAGMQGDFWNLPMDLCETQSQGNEWLFIHYLRNQLSEELYTILADYKLLNDMGNIIAFMMIDEFEAKVYAHKNAGKLTLEQYEALMDDVANAYGGMSFVEENIGDLQSYWKLVVLESPVYYVSYAVSAVASINLFTVAQKDEAAARECYRLLVEEVDVEKGFLWNLEHAGLAGPFEKTVYEFLNQRYAN